MAVSCCVILAGSGILWALVNYIFIPRVVVPNVRQYINLYCSGGLAKLSIKDIRFYPFRGFILKGVEIRGPVSLNGPYLLRASAVGIDLELLPLLWRRVQIKKFGMSGVELNIGRDAQGLWNFQPLLELNLMKEKSVGKATFVVKELRVIKGKINYADYYRKDNTLEHRFSNVNLTLTNPRPEAYKIILSGSSPDGDGESVDLELDYDKSRQSFEGKIRFDTKHLGEYWFYYLDEWLKPWQLEADSITGEAQFSYLKDVFLLDGSYAISGGILNYGDFSIRAGGTVKQRLGYANGLLQEDTWRIELALEDASYLTGKYALLENGKTRAVITEKEITIAELSGYWKGRPVGLSGQFIFGEPHQLLLKGSIGNIGADFQLKLLPSNNQGAIDLQASIDSSLLKLHVDISDLKDLFFTANVEGDVKLADLSGLIKADKDKIKGEALLTGNIKGELDKPSSFEGGLVVQVRDFSLFNLQPVSFDSNVSAKEALFKGDIPEVNFYKGSLCGVLQFDADRWGAGLYVDKLDMEELAKTYPKLQGIKGAFTGNIACVSSWVGLKGFEAGGYFNLVDCDIRLAPVFSDAEKSIESLAKDFIMPTFKDVEGNFTIRDAVINIENAFCSAKTLKLGIAGNYSFSSKMADFTVGANMLGGGVLTIARQIIFPVSIGVDLLANSIRVNVSGKWPDLKHKAVIQPMNWLNEFFNLVNRASPNKYTLDKLWR